MPIPITIPSLGESISEVTLGAWHKQDGDWVEKDDVLVELESDKATQELRAPSIGMLRVKAKTGVELPIGAVVGEIDDAAQRPGGAAAKAGARNGSGAPNESHAAVAEPRQSHAESVRATSVAKKIAAEKGVDIAAVAGTGPSGRVTKDDVLAASTPAGSSATSGTTPAARVAPTPVAPSAPAAPAAPGARTTRRERMTRLRQTIAQRLVEAQHAAAMLTTFNEADMTEVMRLREQHKVEFEKVHGVGLGFMAFFVAASVSALRRFPRVNAFIVGDAKAGMEVQFHDFVDVAVAVGTEKGLVVPVVRNAETLSFAAIERTIKELALRARDGKLAVDEMTGGTFTISNGGVYGSLLSTPILNPPQSAILGMHAIKRRPVEDPSNPGQIALRPMMNLALSYDHRIIDGAEAVGFLVHVRNCIEKPERMLLGV